MRITSYTKIDELLTAKKIKVYTYQNIAVLTDLEKTGYITGEHKHSYAIAGDDIDRSLFEKPYRWMQNQMKKRIKNFSGDLPIWAWLEPRGNINVTKKFGEDQVENVCTTA